MEGYDSSTTYYETGTSSPAADGGMILAILGIYFLVFIVLYVVHAIFLGMIFKKAGIESWKAWVPVYNSWVMLEMGGQKGWLALLAFIPGVSIVTAVFLYIAMYYIGLKLQKEGWFVLLAIFIPTVWVIWLAVDKSTWESAPAEQQPPTVPPTAPQPIA